MGTQEPTWVSLEAAGSATLRVGLAKGMKLNYPRLYLSGMDSFEAYAYVSATVDMRLGGPATNIVLAVVPDF